MRGEAGVLLLGVVRELGGRGGAVTRPGLQRGVATLQTMEGRRRILEKAILYKKKELQSSCELFMW